MPDAGFRIPDQGIQSILLMGNSEPTPPKQPVTATAGSDTSIWYLKSDILDL